MNLYEAQWLAYALPYRRFAAALTDCDARLGADMDRYSFIVSDLHRLLVAGLPAHCERFWTLPKPFSFGLPESYDIWYPYADSGTIGLIMLKDFRLVLLRV
jgi:hypothetical protein